MVKVELEEIIDIVEPVNLIPTEITYFCHDLDIIKQFIENGIDQNFDLENWTEKNYKLKKFLLANEEDIDKDQFLLLAIWRLQLNINLINDKLLRNPLLMQDEKNNSIINLRVQKILLKRLLELAKGIKGFISEYCYDKNKYYVRITDSNEILTGKKSEDASSKKKFDEIDSMFQNDSDSQGLEAAIQVILLTDLYEVFPNIKIAIDIRRMIIENQIIRKGIKTPEELEEINNSNFSGYDEIENAFIFDSETITETKQVLKEYSKYLDLDKLLLICAYRFNDALENGIIDPSDLENVRNILEQILKCIKNKNVKFIGDLQKKEDTDDVLWNVEYSIEDLKKCISRFVRIKDDPETQEITEGRYITEKEEAEIREKVANGEKKLSINDSEVIGIIFSEKELERYCMLSEENLLFVALHNNWDKRKIIDGIRQLGSCGVETLLQLKSVEKIDISDLKEFYLEGIISIEIFGEISEENDVEEIVNLDELIDNYKDTCKNNTREEEKDEARKKLEKYLELYSYLLKNKDENYKQKISENLTMEILDKLDNKELIDVLKLCYINGLIFSDTIAEWCGTEIIEQFYQEKLITLDSIIDLAKKKKIPLEFAISKLKSIIEDLEVDYDEKIKYLKTGLLDENYIANLYKQNIIFEMDFEELGELRIISKYIINKTIRSKKLEDAEANSAIKITGIDELKKIKPDTTRTGTGGRTKKDQAIIDPIQREEYIKMFDAYRATTDLDKNSPFYNYEFYVIPDENGDIGLDSIVIAERYYENKDTEDRLATKNATYFFKYKDLMVLGNFPKSKMVEERKGIVFTSRHTIATEKRVGSWARSVLYNIIKTRFSVDLDKLTEKEKRVLVEEKLKQMYSKSELVKILEMAISIDKGEFTNSVEKQKKDSGQQGSDESGSGEPDAGQPDSGEPR